MDRSGIKSKIIAAFSDVTRDPDQSLHQAQLTDQGISRHIDAKEWRDAGLRDVELDWLSIPGKSIDECDAALSHFTPASWRFYLPAYICRSMEVFSAPRFETVLLSSVIFQLTYREYGSNCINTYLEERYKALSFSQVAAVRDFLKCIACESLRLIEFTNEYWHTYDDANTALASYWDKK